MIEPITAKGAAARLVHDRWIRLRILEHAAKELRLVALEVPPSLAPRSASAIRRARKSIEGAIRHAQGMHQRAQELAERLEP